MKKPVNIFDYHLQRHILTFQAGSVLFDLEEEASDATALSSPQKAQEMDGIQEPEYDQDTEETGESEADPGEDDQCKLCLSAGNSFDNY